MVFQIVVLLKMDQRDHGQDVEGILFGRVPLGLRRAKWLTADYAVKRRLLEIVFLDFVLDDVTLVPETRKPFDMLAEGLLVSSSRADRI